MKKKPILITTVLLLVITQTLCAQKVTFVPDDFKVPDTLENEYFRIRMLTVNDVIKDYDAVMTSIDHLRGVFGAGSEWPSEDLTLEQDLIDLGWHQKEFQRRTSFTYTVVRPDESEVIGCVYIFPTDKEDYDAKITMWVRSSVLDEGMDTILFETVKQWIKEEWPFGNVAYPGRDISWDQWLSD